MNKESKLKLEKIGHEENDTLSRRGIESVSEMWRGDGFNRDPGLIGSKRRTRVDLAVLTLPIGALYEWGWY